MRVERFERPFIKPLESENNGDWETLVQTSRNKQIYTLQGLAYIYSLSCLILGDKRVFTYKDLKGHY